MPQTDDIISEEIQSSAAASGRWGRIRLVLAGAGLILLVLIAITWLERVNIARILLSSELTKLGVPVKYTIDEIGTQRQVLSHIVVGNPGKPDLTVQRAEVAIRYRFGIPTLGQITLDQARLHGSFRSGKLSFGSLDPVIFAKTGAPPRLPRYDVVVNDGRALIESDFGPVGIKAEGKGMLDNGFKGIVAAIAPQIKVGGCSAEAVTLYGTVSSSLGEPNFSGPVRMRTLTCPQQKIAAKAAALQLDATSNANFTSATLDGRFESGTVRQADKGASGLTGSLRGDWRNKAFDVRYTLAARAFASAQADAAVLTLDGSLQARENFEQIDADAKVEGNGVRLGPAADLALVSASSLASGSFAGPLIDRVRSSLNRETKGSRLTGQVNFRKTAQGATLMIPQARLNGGSGRQLMSLSRVQISSMGAAPVRLSGNIAIGGAGLPKIVGRMESSTGGNLVFRLNMQRFAAGAGALAIPDLVISQGHGGALGFAGQLLASGPLPGGSADGLRIPISGNWSPASGLALWRSCVKIHFVHLAFANLSLDQHDLTLCPAKDRAILQSSGHGMQIAAGIPALDLNGTLAGTPIHLTSGAVGFAYPGLVKGQNLKVALGPPDSENKFAISNLDAKLGRDIGGTFSGADIRLSAVPLDLTDTSGSWEYRGGSFHIANAAFALKDRQPVPRFKPLLARDAALTLFDSKLTADAVLRERQSDRQIVKIDIHHNLNSSTGHADMLLDHLRFDNKLQPDQLSDLVLGVIANANGEINGKGRIDWDAGKITSSGEVASGGMDFAAAFGPVKGASGKVIFTDLLNLTTAPNQTLKIASINPGIEVDNGSVTFDIKDTNLLSVKGGHWPFLGGTLDLKPVSMTFGASETRSYVLKISGADAAQFVTQMQLGNLSATGKFDGTIPLVFDALGNGRVEDGVLASRSPGGNVSYVGGLTYKDLSPMANFAFNTLRSLNYREMRVVMNGSLTGELVTNVKFDGVTQGNGAKRNFITKQIAKLPVKFNVNIHAPFYQLITSLKSMYDPAFVRDPRELGLIPSDPPAIKAALQPLAKPSKPTFPEPPVQSAESEKLP